MTTSQGAGTPAKQPAGAAEAAGSELSSQATANAGTPETAPLTGRVAAPPDDLRQLEAEIERTREQLGETVQELVARADVKSLARAKAVELRGRVKDTTSQARKAATAGAVSVRGQLTDKSAAALQKATSAGAIQKDQLRNRAVAVSTPAWQATPEQVRRAVTNGASGAKEHWVPLTLAAGALIAGCMALRRWRRLPAPGRRDEPGPSPVPISRTPCAAVSFRVSDRALPGKLTYTAMADATFTHPLLASEQSPRRAPRLSASRLPGVPVPKPPKDPGQATGRRGHF